MSASYLVRFDDICPGMNWQMWSRVEKILEAYKVRPIVAVVPDNGDRQLEVGPRRNDFWDIVRRWQSMGWTIGWHGYRHVYETAEVGIVGINARSEFAGLSAHEQQQKLHLAYKIFVAERVIPDVWVAPAHSFDQVTIDALRKFDVKVVSDGFCIGPRVIDGVVWLPQQLWRFRRMPAGVWTVCLHINSWSDSQVVEFERAIERFAKQITSVDAVLGAELPQRSALDGVFERIYRALVLARR